MKYKCNKCGAVAEGKSNIPLEHGKMGLVVYPKRNTSKKCDGSYTEIGDFS